jgi:hypothetical protein
LWRELRLATRKDLQQEYESFNQFGLGTSSGIDKAFHSVAEHHRSAVEAYVLNPEVMEGKQPVLVKYDFRSAFFVMWLSSLQCGDFPNCVGIVRCYMDRLRR